MNNEFENYKLKKIYFHKYSSHNTAFKRYEIKLSEFSILKWLLKRVFIIICLFSLINYKVSKY